MKAHCSRITLRLKTNQRKSTIVIVLFCSISFLFISFLLQHLLKYCRTEMDEPVQSVTTSSVKLDHKTVIECYNMRFPIGGPSS